MNATLREKLIEAYMDDIVSLNTVLFFIRQWKYQLLNNLCKN